MDDDLTDEELAGFEKDCADQARTGDGTTYSPSGDLGLRLVAEVRRRRGEAPKGTAHAVTLSEDIGVKPT